MEGARVEKVAGAVDAYGMKGGKSKGSQGS